MSVADKLGFGPKRDVQEHNDGGAIVTVTAPEMFGARPVSVVLSPAEYDGYRRWRNGELIQDALPTLSDAEREKLMTGLDDEAFHRIARDEDA